MGTPSVNHIHQKVYISLICWLIAPRVGNENNDNNKNYNYRLFYYDDTDKNDNNRQFLQKSFLRRFCRCFSTRVDICKHYIFSMRIFVTKNVRPSRSCTVILYATGIVWLKMALISDRKMIIVQDFEKTKLSGRFCSKKCLFGYYNCVSGFPS